MTALARLREARSRDGRQHSSRSFRAKGCPHFLLGVLSGFAGVVQSLAGLDSCGINLSGLSSSGKTTAQRLAVSAWTSRLIGAGLLQSMRSTENAVEGLRPGGVRNDDAVKLANGVRAALDKTARAKSMSSDDQLARGVGSRPAPLAVGVDRLMSPKVIKALSSSIDAL